MRAAEGKALDAAAEATRDYIGDEALHPVGKRAGDGDRPADGVRPAVAPRSRDSHFPQVHSVSVDLAVLGFSKGELAKALTPASFNGLTDEDTVPDVSEQVVTRPGDVWCLGEHRMICGDSTDPATVQALLGEIRPVLMVTDPPYGVNYDPEWWHRAGVNSSSRTGKVENDGRADWAEAWALFPGNTAYVWQGALHATKVASASNARASPSVHKSSGPRSAW